MLFPLLLEACALLLLLFLNALPLLPPALLVLLLLCFTRFASLLLFFLALLLARLLLLLLATLPLLFLCLVGPFPLALPFALLFELGLPLLATSITLLLPLFFGLAPALFLVGSHISAYFLYALLAHLGQALLLDQLVEQGAHRVRDLAVDVAALARALDQGCGDSRVLGQQGRVAVGLAVDKVLEGGEKVGFGGLSWCVRVLSKCSRREREVGMGRK